MFTNLQAWLAAHPDLARVALATVVFLIVYLVRKLAPSLWLRFEVLSPALNVESEWLSEQLHKLYQALPSAVLGAILGPLMTGGDWRQSALGALNGLAAPVSHELLSRYQGKLGKSKPKGPTSGRGDVDDTVSLMPEPVRLVAEDRSRLHNDRPDEPAECSKWRHPDWRLALTFGVLLACVLSCHTPPPCNEDKMGAIDKAYLNDLRRQCLSKYDTPEECPAYEGLKAKHSADLRSCPQ